MKNRHEVRGDAVPPAPVGEVQPDVKPQVPNLNSKTETDEQAQKQEDERSVGGPETA